jgi:hypothetical protein
LEFDGQVHRSLSAAVRTATGTAWNGFSFLGLGAKPWASGNPRRVKMDSLLRGLLYCSGCGSGVYSTYSAGKNRHYRYYV